MDNEAIKIFGKINSIDWVSKDFSHEKAYVCSYFSKLAYKHIPEFELDQSGRIKIITSQDYFDKIKKRQHFDIKSFLRENEFEDVFTIETKYAVLIGVRTSKVTIIAIRGTAALTDWLINLKFKKAKFITHSDFKFHYGFHKAISEHFNPLYEELRKQGTSNTPIYVTGHSLGGAMAAILHAYWGEASLVLTNLYYYLFRNAHLQTNSCYTFGMPRYGNFESVNFLPTPYHFYNDLDIVPTIPPKWLGFESAFTEYKIDSNSVIRQTNRRSISFIKWLYRLSIGGGIQSHSIELYNERLANLVS